MGHCRGDATGELFDERYTRNHTGVLIAVQLGAAHLDPPAPSYRNRDTKRQRLRKSGRDLLMSLSPKALILHSFSCGQGAEPARRKKLGISPKRQRTDGFSSSVAKILTTPITKFASVQVWDMVSA
jgi:hypothetical protein